MNVQRFIVVSTTFCVMCPAVSAQQPPSFAGQVKPFLAKYCLECHSSDKTKGGLNLESFKSLMAGGDNGAALVPGKPDESKLVVLTEGKEKPRMPPKKAKQPKAEESAVLRAWVSAGARDDSGTFKPTLPNIKPKRRVPAAVAALAYHPDGKRLAVGAAKEVVLLDVASGDELGRLPGQFGSVTALAFSRDGTMLAVASSAPGSAGELRLYAVPAGGMPAEKPAQVIAAHVDAIHALAWNPDNKMLASTGYDRLIKLWDATTGQEIRTLKDHSDTVYGLEFSGDGRLLASASADRAVKVWDAAKGTRLYTLGEATDWLYALAWSPDHRHLAAAGVDKSIRVWEATPASGKLVQTVFAHEAAVIRLAYSADGKTLYSLSEDRGLKAWDTERMVERQIYASQPEAPLALAVRPDHKQLALGRYDGVVLLLDEATGKTQSQPLPAKPKPPRLDNISPAFGLPGTTVRVRCAGNRLDGVSAASISPAGPTAKIAAQTPAGIEVDVTLPTDTSAGVYQLALKNAVGTSPPVSFFVDRYPSTGEQESNDTPRTAHKVTLPVSVAGSLTRAGDVDYYRIEARAGEHIGVQVLTSAGAKFDPVLMLLDGAGKVLAESERGVLGHVCATAGSYALGIRDRKYRGGDLVYHLHVGDIPVVTSVFPLGVQRGSEADVRIEGVHLGSIKSVRTRVPADAEVGSAVPLPIPSSRGKPLGAASVIAGEFAEIVSGATPLPVPGTANGVITRPPAVDAWRFSARKGQRLLVEVHARRLGSPLDSTIEIVDAKGQPVPLATLRGVAQTVINLRDHDSASPGIRLESWNDFAVNDYVIAGSEVMRIRTLPKHPDDDCQFFSIGKQRVGYLGTTPTHHSMGETMYKVAVHPPGTTFPPNGLPLFTLYHRNDDGGAGYGKDSRLFFDPPADGDYQVRVGDARGQAGSDFAYRLTVRPPRPSYTISFSPRSPKVWKGGGVPVTVTADRLDGFSGAIDIRLENLPPGFTAPATNIPEGEESTAFSLWADATASTPKTGAPLKVTARAIIAGQEVVREAVGQLPSVTEPGDLFTATEQSTVILRPGSEVRLKVLIERRNGFTGRVPLEVLGLPHGVRVIDVGLNGIVVTPGETSRVIVLHADPWVKPMEHPFVVLSRRERKQAEHAARSILLKVVK